MYTWLLCTVVVRQRDHDVLDKTKLHRLIVGKIMLREHTHLWTMLALLRTQQNSINLTRTVPGRCHVIGYCELSKTTATAV